MTNKQLTLVCAVLTALLTVTVIMSFNILKDYENSVKAIQAVDDYINLTEDTGQMDDFLESPEGRTYVKYTR